MICVGLLLGDLGEVGRGGHAGAERGQPGRAARPPRGAGCGSPRRGPAPGPGRCGPGWRGRRTTPAPALDAVAADQEAGDLLGGRGGQRDQPAARPDGRQHVLDGRRAEHPHRARGGLLDRLEQRVAGLLGEPVGVLDDEDLPAPADRAPAPSARTRSRTSLTPIDSFSVRISVDVGVASRRARCGTRGTRRSRPPGPCSHCSAAANATAALERPEPGRPGEQPGVAHAVAAGRGPQRLDRRGAGRPGRPRRVIGVDASAAAWPSSGVDPLADRRRRSRRRRRRASSTR